MELKDIKDYYCSDVISCSVQWRTTREWEELMFENWEILSHWLARHFYDLELETVNIRVKDFYRCLNGKEC